MLKFCNKVIEYCFYGLFFLTPLAFTSNTSELFEFNKMWTVFVFTIIIATFWLIKMFLHGRILFCRTPLDIPILLFLSSQFISSIISLDPHISFWGYYSRFNGGFLSILSYILLYYAFVSNFAITKRGVTRARDLVGAQSLVSDNEHQRGGERQDPELHEPVGTKMVKRILKLSLLSGLIVALWGLPSHFGYDPTCLIFRGSLDVACWTDAFQPKVRIFSTMGQPNWLAAYLAVLIPIAIAFFIKNSNIEYRNSKQYQNQNDKNSKRFEYSNLKNWNLFRISNFGFSAYVLIIILYFIDLLFTSSRSGFLGLAVGLIFFFIVSFYVATYLKNIVNIKYIAIPFVIFAIFSLFLGTPLTPKITDVVKISSDGIQSTVQIQNKPQGPALEVGGTESGKIRKIVWQGAVDIWKNNPLFGTGVETFAFAYYKFRPAEHNLVSEWDYLYNKAHNEYLNYLATTGLFGLGSYLSIIGLFFLITLKNIKINLACPEAKPKDLRFFANAQNDNKLLVFALLASYLSILVSNFFGFSVVLINLYFFFIPAFVFVLMNMIKPNIKPNNEAIEQSNNSSLKFSTFQWFFTLSSILVASYSLITFYRFWLADTSYALGYNLDRAGAYDQAYQKLKDAIDLRSSEPVFQDELSINNAVLAIAYATQKDATRAAELAQQAIETSNQVVQFHPQNIVFWKTRARLFYTLAQADSQYFTYALQSLQAAHELAPTDAKIAYNLGVLYGQTGNLQKGTELIQQAIKLKPDYKDAYYALGLFYREQAIDKNGKVIKQEFQQKAAEAMRLILSRFATDDAQAAKSLKDWGEI